MKRYVFLMCLLLKGSLSFPQIDSPAYLDSLQHAMQTAKDTNKVLILQQLAVNYAFYKPDSGFYYASEGLRLAEKLQYKEGIALSLIRFAAYFRSIGSSTQAMQYAQKALPLFENLKDTDNIVLCNLMLNWVYYDQEEYDSAFAYTKKATSLAHNANSSMIYWCFSSFMELYKKSNRFDSAIIYAKKSDSVSHNEYPIKVLAEIYSARHDTANALKYYKEALALRENYLFRANIAQLEGHPDSAAYYAKEMLVGAEERKYLEDVTQASELLFTIYSSLKKSDSALKYILIAHQAKDSLFSKEKARQFQSAIFADKLHQQEMVTLEKQNDSRRKIFILLVTAGMVLLIAFFLYRSNRKTKKTNAILKQQKEKVESTLSELKSTQAQLIQSEKMASLGELTAGIAHEIQNPLNFVNNFSEVNKELLEELKDEADKGNIDEVKSIANDVIENSEKINHHGKRADGIVKGMLEHSRTSTGVKEPTDINALADEYLKLSYHGLRAKNKEFNAIMKTDFDESIGKINIIPQDIGRVLLNLYNNAFYAVSKRQEAIGKEFQATVSVSTRKVEDRVAITVKDNGGGIPEKIKEKIFQPFFTTKPTGQGTGLGLSISYDIVKAHGGEIKVNTVEGEFTEFVVQLPVQAIRAVTFRKRES